MLGADYLIKLRKIAGKKVENTYEYSTFKSMIF